MDILNVMKITHEKLYKFVKKSITSLLSYYLLTHSMVQNITWKTVTQIIKKYPTFFMEPEGSSLFSHKLATGPYHEPAESGSPHQSLMLSSHLRLGLPTGLLLLGLPTKTL
jgi:hypothetical protein